MTLKVLAIKRLTVKSFLTIQNYTVSQKTIHLTFEHNFGKCRLIFKILSLSDSRGNSLCNYYRIFCLTLIVLQHYFAKLKNLD